MASEDQELSTFLQFRYDPSPAPEASFTMRITEGPSEGKVLVVDGTAAGRTHVGQSHAVDLVIDDRQVSRRHLALDVAGRRLHLVDMGSTNGTFVDGLRVVEAYLQGGELVRIGSTAILVERGSAAEASPPPMVAAWGRLVGGSREMRRLYPLCERLARSNVPVIIEGETGTGKEVLAEAIHEGSARKGGPFIVFDCTTSHANLIESELFGHERGAFTGAQGQRKGVFEQAHGGTLLIDEIGDMDLSLQPKLLRALERNEVRRVGGDKWIRTDVRVLAATRRNLEREVQVGRFRDDLYHRLAVARIELPALRQRKGDISLLARVFCEQLGGSETDLPPELLSRWEDESWPGNVRELRNAVARHLALGEFAALAGQPEPRAPAATRPADSSSYASESVERGTPLVEARQQLVAEFERQYLTAALAATGGNVTKAAALAGIPRRYFQILRARYA